MAAQGQRQLLDDVIEMLLRQDVDRVLHRVGRHHVAVVAAQVRCAEVTLQRHRHLNFMHRLPRALTSDAQNPHPFLAVTISRKFHNLFYLS